MSAESAPARVDEPQPSGVVSFAFTDIEGSTVRWERDADAMDAALRLHDTVVRRAIVECDGYVFKTVGDAFCAAFSRPEDAVAAMLAAQNALSVEDFSAVGGLRVRAAVHTGTVGERDGDYFGPVVNRVARLLAIGHGGQILVSGATRDLVEATLPAQVTLRDLGEHRLRDLTRAERVYQLVALRLDRHFPPLRSLSALPNNLPLQLTSFVGREDEVAKIEALLRSQRLVTVVGSGGVGKTRAALRVAASLLDGSGDGVWFVELAPLSSGEHIPTTVAHAMGITLEGEGDSLAALTAALSSKRALLVFDNCEHLLEPVARVVATLLRSCRQIHVLATARQAIGISGETTFRMPSLTLPEVPRGLSADAASRFPAIALFVERAVASDDRFTLTDDNAGAVADICRRLDGIPLAIELAAARVGILSPAQLRERLDQRFRVLVGGRRDLLPRQQTLRALIDWSYDLLDERERALFRRLGVFANGFTLDGALAVGCDERLDEFDVCDLLASLVDKSLVLSAPDGETLRYRILESTRSYALEKLEAASEYAAARACHLRFVCELFSEIRERWEYSGSATEMDARLIVELEDVRVALDSAEATTAVELGAEILAAVDTRWERVGLGREGSSRLERFILLLPPAARRVASRLWESLSGLAWLLYLSPFALEAAIKAVTFAREADDAGTLAGALTTYASSLSRNRAFREAAAALAEAEALIPPPNALLRLRLLEARGFLAMFSGDLDLAADTYALILNVQRELHNTTASNILILHLAEVEHQRGQSAKAVSLVEETLPALQAGRDRTLLVNALTNLCAYLVALDRISEALALGREIFTGNSEYDVEGALATCLLECIALALGLDGDPRLAAVLAGYTDAVLTRVGLQREYTERTTRTRLERILGETLGAEDLAALLREGAALLARDAIALVAASATRDVTSVR